MRELDHHRRAIVVTFIREPAEPRHDLILAGKKIANDGSGIARNDADPAVMVSAIPPLAIST